MSNFYHPIYSTLESISGRIDDLVFESKKSRNPEHVILDNKEASEILKISVETLKNWREEGLLPYSKVKSKVYYTLSDIIELVQSNYVKKK